MDSTTTIIGNVTREPELRFTPSGQAVIGFGVAVNRKWQNKTTNQWEEQVSFIDVTAWGTLAENISASLDKGARCIVTGRLEQQNWEQDGVKRSKIQIVADSVGPDLRWATCLVTKNERSTGNQQGGGQPGQQRPTQPAAPAANPYADEEPF